MGAIWGKKESTFLQNFGEWEGNFMESFENAVGILWLPDATMWIKCVKALVFLKDTLTGAFSPGKPFFDPGVGAP